MHLQHTIHLPSVLIVDDDPSLRAMVRVWVEALGFPAREAHAADAALDALAVQPAGIALCDINMPGQSGVWLASRIRDCFPDTAVIVATAVRDVETAIASLRNEVVDYLLKPFDRVRLREALALARDWHNAAAAQAGVHHALEDRLRSRRTEVAATLARAQHTSADALEGFMGVLQLHERDGRGHALRVARLSVSIADTLGFDERALALLEQGALLHDIGKLEMPASILSKPAPLDDEEWEVMRTHPQVGYDLLKSQPRFAGAADMVLAHHEAYDGSGYPRGLRRDEIPLSARILAVADAYDSMTHPHTQRPPMSPALAIEEIARCSGSQFDPRCAETLGLVLVDAMERESFDAAV